MVYLSDESCHLVAIKIWADLRHFAVEDIVVRSSFISASNLQWQSDFRSEIPMLVAGDLSVFSASPKETYLQEKFNELRSLVEVNLYIVSLTMDFSCCSINLSPKNPLVLLNLKTSNAEGILLKMEQDVHVLFFKDSPCHLLNVLAVYFFPISSTPLSSACATGSFLASKPVFTG